MRLALVSDIHGNLAALEAIIADLENRQSDQVSLAERVGVRIRTPPKVYHLPGLPSLAQKPPAPRSQPLGLVRLEMSEG
jgi:hypothetical protein